MAIRHPHRNLDMSEADIRAKLHFVLLEDLRRYPVTIMLEKRALGRDRADLLVIDRKTRTPICGVETKPKEPGARAHKAWDRIRNQVRKYEVFFSCRFFLCCGLQPMDMVAGNIKLTVANYYN